MGKLKGVKVRMLNASEFGRVDLVKIFHENKSIVPNSLNANIQIAEDENGKIVGIAVLQPQYHAEPIYVAKEYRDTGLHVKLIDELLKPLTRFKQLQVFVFAPNSKIVKLAARFGFKQLDYTVFVRKF